MRRTTYTQPADFRRGVGCGFAGVFFAFFAGVASWVSLWRFPAEPLGFRASLEIACVYSRSFSYSRRLRLPGVDS